MSTEDHILQYVWATRDYVLRVADAVDREADSLATTIRGAISKTASSVRAAAAPPPPPAAPAATSLYDRAAGLLERHRTPLLVLAGLAGAGLAAVAVQRQRRRSSSRRKRRAARAANNARTEAAVVWGSPHDPLARSLAQDLERRGFVVFVVVHSMDDEQVVLGEGRRDLRPLNVDLLDGEGAAAAVARLGAHLRAPLQAFAGAAPHRLRLAGMVLAPAAHYHQGPVELLPPDAWSDALNLRVLAPVLTARLFAPLLREHRARLLVLAPAVVPAVAPAFHAPEACAAAALQAFAHVLRRELLPLGVPVALLRLGTFDLAHLAPRAQQQQAATADAHALNAARADIVAWSAGARAARGAVRGSSVRVLHHGVFDALTAPRVPRVVRLGSGSLVYELVGNLLPDALVAWMLDRSGGEARASGGDDESRGASPEGHAADWEKVERMA